MGSKLRVTRPKSMKAKARSEVPLGFEWGMLNWLFLAAGVMALSAGYLDLVRGSITLAPGLLVTGYCVLIPAALLVRGRGREPGE